MNRFEEKVIVTSNRSKKSIAKSLYISPALNDRLRILLKEYNKNSSVKISTNEVLNLLLEQQIETQIRMVKEGRLKIY